jgi:hypothetical protein
MFAALYLLYAVAGVCTSGGPGRVLIGVGAIGAVLGSLVTKAWRGRIGTGWA